MVVKYHTSISNIKKKPKYELAKNGDLSAAREIVRQCINRSTISYIKQHYSDCVLLPVISNNKLPLALALETGLPVCTSVRIKESSNRKHMNAMQRLLFSPTFIGELKKTKYILVDDIITQGGTINSLCQFVQRNSSTVAAIMVLATAKGGNKITPEKDKIQALENKFNLGLGDMLAMLGGDTDIELFTHSQISYILRFSNTVNFINKAKINISSI